MKIYIQYDSKWSARFNDKENNLLFEGLPTLNKVIGIPDDTPDEEKQLAKESLKKELTGFISGESSYHDVMKKIAKKFPNYQFQSLEKTTIIGVLCRLIGENRKIKNIFDENHLILSHIEKVNFSVLEQENYNELITIFKPEGVVQNNGGALIYQDKEDFPLITKNIFSEILYELYTCGDERLNDYIDSMINHTFSLDNFSKTNIKKQKFSPESFLKIFSEIDSFYQDKNNQDNYLKLKDKIFMYLHQTKETKTISIPGVLIYFLIKILKSYNVAEKEISLLLPNGKTNIKGFAELRGGITIRDFYGNFAPNKKSWQMPYMIKTDATMFEKGAFNFGNNLGINKESGLLVIELDGEKDWLDEIYERIRANAVATFYLGKKGLAFVERIEYE